MDTGFRRLLSAINRKNNGSIIYTGDPDFNERYLSRRRTLRLMLAGKFPKPLATREEEFKLAADFYKTLVIAFLPKIHRFYKNKKIRRTNASKDRKLKPSKAELVSSREKYNYFKGTYYGWVKAATREFKLCEKTINEILEE